MTKRTVILEKADYSEECIRKALYWFSAFNLWELTESPLKWTVNIVDHDDKSEANLHRLLNDQKLRERIDIETASIRRSIVRKVLSSLETSL